MESRLDFFTGSPGDVITNSASVSPTTYEANLMNNQASTTVTVTHIVLTNSSGGGGCGAACYVGTTDIPVSTPATTVQIDVPTNVLVKLPDDKNPDTQADSAVYYIDVHGTRHAFPNAAVFLTWYPDFSTVQIIASSTMSSMPLGKNVTYKPGVKMVKFTTTPKTYAVDKKSVLRWVQTEELAEALYGSNWSTKIDDIPDTFFTNYTFGSDILSTADFNPTQIEASVPSINDNL